VRFLEKAKNTIPNTYLIVGVTDDTDTLNAKGPTVMSGAERSEIVRACKYVDEVIQDCPPVLLPEFLEECNIDYFGHDDDPVRPGHPDPYEFAKRDGRFLVIPRTNGISSTYILTRVLRNRDKYMQRQVRWGVSREDLNIT
jgi:choline-phosphate cytidylyltransferase